MQIIFEAKYAIQTDAQVVVNSANAWLFADSSGAGAIRESTPQLTQQQEAEYKFLFQKLPLEAQEFFKHKQQEHGWQLHAENLSCMRLLATNNYKPFAIGSAILDFDISQLTQKVIVHAITMSYDPIKQERITATPDSIAHAIDSSLHILLEHGKNSIALPIPCARPDYGMTPKKSYDIITTILKKYADRAITVHLCFDNTFTKEFLETSLRGSNH